MAPFSCLGSKLKKKLKKSPAGEKPTQEPPTAAPSSARQEDSHHPMSGNGCTPQQCFATYILTRLSSFPGVINIHLYNNVDDHHYASSLLRGAPAGPQPQQSYCRMPSRHPDYGYGRERPFAARYHDMARECSRGYPSAGCHCGGYYDN